MKTENESSDIMDGKQDSSEDLDGGDSFNNTEQSKQGYNDFFLHKILDVNMVPI